MVTLYVRGQRVSWAEAEKALAEAPAGVNEIELRNDAGRILGEFCRNRWPAQMIPIGSRRSLRRRSSRLAEPFMTLEEFKKQQGWT